MGDDEHFMHVEVFTEVARSILDEVLHQGERYGTGDLGDQGVSDFYSFRASGCSDGETISFDCCSQMEIIIALSY